jgi:hypothetical protein
MSRPVWILALTLAATPGAFADTKEKLPVERTTNDRKILDTLTEIHDKGAALYDGGDPGSCYRMFQGGLMAVRILLPTDLQSVVDTGLADAARLPAMSSRAMLLHEVIEDVRKKLHKTAGPKMKGTLLNPPRPVTSTGGSAEPLPPPILDKPPKKPDPPIGPPIVPVNAPTKGTPAPVTTAPASDDPPPLPFVPKIPNPDGK